MFGIGNNELLLIMLAVFVLFGAKRIPEVARTLGKGMGDFKDALSGVEREIRDAADPASARSPRPAPAAGALPSLLPTPTPPPTPTPAPDSPATWEDGTTASPPATTGVPPVPPAGAVPGAAVPPGAAPAIVSLKPEPPPAGAAPRAPVRDVGAGPGPETESAG